MKLIIKFLNNSVINKLFQKIVNSKFSKIFIPLFRNYYKINTEEILQPQKFNTLNDFFTRDIDMKYRPMSDAKYISPCDGVITAAGNISDETTFEVKGKIVDVEKLLEKKVDVKSFQVIYLSPHNYHQFHAIDDNNAVDIYSIGDKSLPVNDIGFRLGNPFLKNYRIIMETKDYYYIAMGATNVNSIEFSADSFKRGERIGEFRFGSTIVLLYKEELENLRIGEIKVRQSLLN